MTSSSPCNANIREAQRPCSRCLSNGKEDACVDVQHKKRGRPRLRDDRDARYDPLRLQNYSDMSLRGPISTYPTGSPLARGLPGDAITRHHSFRPLESPGGVPLPLRLFDRPTDASSYTPSVFVPSHEEPGAYLTMGMEFAKASPTFLEAIGIANVMGRSLREIVANIETDKIFHMQNQLGDAQKRREPNYLPPILSRGGLALQGLGFSTNEVARFSLSMQEHLTFVGSDGIARPYVVRLGLGKEGSFYFVAMLLSVPPRRHYAQSRNAHVTTAYHTPPSPQPASFAGRGLEPRRFDPVRPHLNEGPLQIRPPLRMQEQGNADIPRSNTGAAPTFHLYDSADSRSRYAGSRDGQSPHEGSRSLTPYASDHATVSSYQLPPIRAQSEHRAPHGAHGWQRDERSGRVDLGNLIDKTEGSARQ